MNSPEKILVAGSGALATLFAARLSAAGIKVSILGTWQDGLSAIKKHGAILVTPDGEEHAYPIQVLEEASRLERFQYALVLVKSWQTGRVARQLLVHLAQDGLALTLQNGLGNREILSDSLGTERVAQGVTTMGGTLLSPGRVRLGGDGSLALEAHPKLEKLAGLLVNAGFQVNIVPEARSLVWGKLVVNSAINPLTAILRVTNGELLDHPSSKGLLGALARETAAVAVLSGITLPFLDPVEAAEGVAERTATNRSSMLQDVLRHAPTEIEAISGAIINLGGSLGLPTPFNECMYQLVKTITSSYPH
jgi:2-dehydropantoate 2-reductase